MKVIVAGRGAGKTHDLVQWVKDGNRTDRYPGWDRILLCHSIQQSVFVRGRWDLHPHQVMSVVEWRSRYRPAFADSIQVAVDDADLILAHLLEARIDRVAITGAALETGLEVSRG